MSTGTAAVAVAHRTRAAPAVVAVTGALGLVAVAAFVGVPQHDAAITGLVAGGTATIAAVLGAVALRLLGHRSITTLITATAIVVLVSAALGAWVGAQAMFLSEHDVGAVSVILVSAGTVGVITAVLVSRRIARASDALVAVARDLGRGAGTRGFVPVPEGVPRELAHVHAELQMAAIRLEDARHRAEALESSRRELVAWVSHDLRTPLAGIRAVAEALEDGVVTDRTTVARYCSTIRREAERLSGLVDDLFELSRTQAGLLRLEFERIALDDLVSDAVAGITPVAAAKGVAVEGRVRARSEVEASAPDVLRALRNILENAIRHTPCDGSIVVEADADGDHAFVSVRDTGGGIAADDLSRVFDVAFRGDPARSDGNGAGLGLAIARGLIEAHHGEITVRNEPLGACFTVRLPIDAGRVPG